MEMTQAHKDALAEGRKQARAIKAYLYAIEARTHGRTVSRESLQTRLERLDGQIDSATNPLKELDLRQTRLDVEAQLSSLADVENFEELEEGFVTHAADYSTRKGISYTAWRQIGVPATTLRAAGIKETRRRG